MNLINIFNIIFFALGIALMMAVFGTYLYILYVYSQQPYPYNIMGMGFFMGIGLMVSIFLCPVAAGKEGIL